MVQSESDYVDIIRKIHEMDPSNHTDVNTTVERVVRRYLWNGIEKDVAKFVSINSRLFQLHPSDLVVQSQRGWLTVIV